MPASVQQTEAIKLMGDWSKWLIAVQTAGIGFVATLLKPEKPSAGGALPPLPPLDAKVAFYVALVCFVSAVIAAGALQSGLPSAVTDLNPLDSEDKLWDRSIYFLNKSFGKIWIAAESQFALFLIGIAALSWSVCRLMR